MASRRMGPADAAVRTDLLDATERVLARDGYAAVTSRNVGKEAGVTQKLVYYYFQNMEELIVATFRRRSEAFLARMEEALKSDRPVRSLWEISSHRSARVVLEFMAMATRSPAVHAEVSRYTARANALQSLAFAPGGSFPGLPGGKMTANLITFLVASMARNLVLENELDLLRDAAELEHEIEAFLGLLEPDVP